MAWVLLPCRRSSGHRPGVHDQALAGLHPRQADGPDAARALGELRSVGEPLTKGRVLAAALIVAGLSLMKLSTSA